MENKTKEKSTNLKIEEIPEKNKEPNNIFKLNQNLIKNFSKTKNEGQFILGKKLGEGTFGIVRVATHYLTGEKVAVKILDKKKIFRRNRQNKIRKRNKTNENIIQT